jgi:predicted phage-related endonuclease
MELTALALLNPFGKSTLTTERKTGEMSTQINLQMIDLDPTASSFLSAYIEAKAKVKEWEEKADIARSQVEAAMGDCEVGLVNGREAVRWTTVEANRIDTKKIRELLPPEMVAAIEVKSISRRFSIVSED